MKLIAKLLAADTLTSTLLSGLKGLKMSNSPRGNEIAIGEKKLLFPNTQRQLNINYRP